MEDVKTVGKNRTTDLKSRDGGITYSYETIHPPSKKLSTLYYLNAGLVHWLFSFCFLWTLWNNQLSSFDARRLLRSLAILFGTAFVLKHLLLASLYSPEGGWLQRMAGTLLQGVAIGTLDAPTFAPVTGYIAFLTLSLYVAGLILLALAVNSNYLLLSDRPYAKQFWMTQVTRDSSRNFLGAEAVAVDLVNSDLVADNSLGGIQ